ncbi:MAG: hypothetical protein ACR2FY_24765 [Pirellulaceae bacterium]
MKFSIRDLLLVTVIVALAMGWWVDRSSLAKQIPNPFDQRLSPDSGFIELYNLWAPAPNPPTE